jgi:hypothetical protein
MVMIRFFGVVSDKMRVHANCTWVSVMKPKWKIIATSETNILGLNLRNMKVSIRF